VPRKQKIVTVEEFKALAGKAMTEDEFQRQVIALARLRGWKAAHFRRVRVARKSGSTYWETPVAADGKGWPDLFLAKPCFRPLAWELKVEPNRASQEQLDWLYLLTASGIDARVLYPEDWDLIVRILSAEARPFT
jgi:hypothetical protein